MSIDIYEGSAFMAEPVRQGTVEEPVRHLSFAPMKGVKTPVRCYAVARQSRTAPSRVKVHLTVPFYTDSIGELPPGAVIPGFAGEIDGREVMLVDVAEFRLEQN